MGMRIDKTRSERQTVGIDLTIRLRRAEVANGHDAVAGNAHIGAEPWASQPIENGGIADDQIAA
ncbi:MAG: hypothetical protein QOF90_2191, partial [Acetobacteraceae bacterium]|nr:hypothetical protein [Acetobacteraceae bacterium]